MWLRLDVLDALPAVARLNGQTNHRPAQYQFTDPALQHGLHAEHMLLLVTSLTPPSGPGWQGWASDELAARWLNNPHVEETCKLASGYLGALLAKQRPHWDFSSNPLSDTGRFALWHITNYNSEVESIRLCENGSSCEDVHGLARMLGTCDKLKLLDLSKNDLGQLLQQPPYWQILCGAFGNNRTLTSLNLTSNGLGPKGVATAARALVSCSELRSLAISQNQPGADVRELAELLGSHAKLTAVELVEKDSEHLPGSAKDTLSEALVGRATQQLAYLSIDKFKLTEETARLTWSSKTPDSDARLLSRVLVSNTVLSTLDIDDADSLSDGQCAIFGEALLCSQGSRVGFCNALQLYPFTTIQEYDLSKAYLRSVKRFRLLAGCLRNNVMLSSLTLRNLPSELVHDLGRALVSTRTLSSLQLTYTQTTGGEASLKYTATPTVKNIPYTCDDLSMCVLTRHAC